ncbi:allene oxide synthase-lipoxygenase protein-like isoform X2 [Dendronephthya gigantea]|uniref:allene oxide synthase-lipoxygenase protein-like isoform X2 n=1 Tax=Dendronephthya gigantea TaxID=151771 RepID=UPI00106CDCA8|nr:allene oxide synthase-lipoxygenase protein-like isoform X2 [Dendronephthya gigantea]
MLFHPHFIADYYIRRSLIETAEFLIPFCSTLLKLVLSTRVARATFVQRYRVVQDQVGSKGYCVVTETSVPPEDKKFDELVAMINVIACKQQKLEECLTAAVNQNGEQQKRNNFHATSGRRNRPPIVCYNCGQPGYLAKDCGQENSENFGYEIYKQIKGEDEFEKKMKEANTFRQTGIFDGIKLALEKNKIKLLFGVAALSRGKRPTHAVGIAARGVATVVNDPQFPPCEFFTPGRSFPVCLRHATLKSIDDAMLDFLSASIRFADSEEEKSQLDILMSTGRSNPLSNVKGIYDAVAANKSGNLKDYYLDSPDRLASNIDGLRRAPDSFFDQRYYSEIILGFNASDAVQRYARFRLIPEDGSMETGLLSKDNQRHIWKNERLPSEIRSKDYLKEEFKQRILAGAVRYKLQMTLHQAQSDDPPGILDIAKYWDETTHEWVDVADVTLTTLLTPDTTAGLRYNPGNLPDSLYFLPARSIHDSNCIAHIRMEVYAFTQQFRYIRSSKMQPDHVATYTIQVDAAGHATSKAGDNHANISISLTGSKGKTERLSLNSLSDEVSSASEYTLQAMDIGEVLMVHIFNDSRSWYKDCDWFCNKITVTSSKYEKSLEFPCYRWVVSNMVIFQAMAVLPFQDQPEAIRLERVLELQERKTKYRWGEMPSTGSGGLPGFVHAPQHEDIPRDSQFSVEASVAFNRGRVFGGVNLGLSFVYNAFTSWDDFDCFKKIFTGWTGDVPEISRNEMWMEDRIFGYQFLNGCNPCTIRRCNELPENFPVTDKMVKNFLDRGQTLTEEIKNGHVYIVDYKDLEGIKRNGEDGCSELCYAAEPLCLFYVRSSGDLIPIAIQLFQQPGETNPIWTPDDAKYDWLLAKMWFRNADHQIHQMEIHLLRTHLVMEAFSVAAWRQLPSIHPVFQLLFPHLRSVMAINTIGRNELVSKGGIVDKTLSIGGGGHIELLEKTYSNFMFEMLSLPDMLKSRGVDDTDKLPNYYYRDDGLLLWAAISNFIVEFLSIFYHSDDDVYRDHEIQSWVADIHDNGLPTREGDVDHGFPSCLHTRDELAHVLTCIIFTCSCQHAAVNFPQLEITGFIPNVPPAMRQPPPAKKNQANLQSIMETLPNKSQAGWHVGTMYTLTRIAEDERYIGDYTEGLLSGTEIEGVTSRFQSSLLNISKAIRKRNASVEFPYTYLLPERVPNSIGI